MIRYTFYQKNPSSHYIYIDMEFETKGSELLKLQLPAWRPGRYELGNFAKNVKRVDIFDATGKPLAYTKKGKDTWEIAKPPAGPIKITYSYYASELNAGACYADNSQVYVNPVHCCMFIEGRTAEEHKVELRIPEDYVIATSLRIENNILTADDFEELADSPFIAGRGLQSMSYKAGEKTFFIHFQGECRPDEKKFIRDFSAFTEKLIEFWGDFPYNEFHFLFQVTPFKFYHGVEHKKNTVIAIGPGYSLNAGSTYEDVLGVSCHELFHVWNVKTIRPVEMMPYDLTKENYSRTGYVYEGFTTYYGDKLLLSSNVFTTEQYFPTLEERLSKHFHNYGRYNLSVAHSSWETWLDGYVPGAPYRKTSIYDEGSLIAFMLDVQILKASENRRSLRDVCRLMYQRFGKENKGYSERDIIETVNEVHGSPLDQFFTDYVYTAADYEPMLQECFSYLGIEMIKQQSAQSCERDYGFKAVDGGTAARVSLVAPYSPSWKAGLFAGDEIIAVNNMMVKSNLNNWLSYFSVNDPVSLTISSGEQVRTIIMNRDKKGANYFFSPVLKMKAHPTESERLAFEAWTKV